MDEEIKSAQSAGALGCIELDANSKLGPSIIPRDPKAQSKNGKLLVNVVNVVIVVNGTDLCKGVITRQKTTTIIEEKSVLDFFIVCEAILSNDHKYGC